ncbi:MAG: DUF4124 domain-containing protein [Xanthomonadales bacterium]|nr:DUF4124 domain-containing protein [Xanthomonadales bacterium]
MTNKTWSAFFLIAALLVILPALASAGNIYKWVDSKGNLHFGEKVPEGIQAEKITPDTRKVGTAAPSAQELQVSKEEALIRKETAAAEKEKRRTRKEDKALREKHCATARKRIATLEPTPRILVKNKDGTTRRLNDDERLDWLQKSRDAEKEYCGK